jgi:hypothetical protein
MRHQRMALTSCSLTVKMPMTGLNISEVEIS